MRRLTLIFAISTLAGCLPAPMVDFHGAESEDDPIADGLTSGSSVMDATRASCSTGSIKPLSLQIMQEMRTLRPDAIEELSTPQNVHFTDVVLPFLSTRAAMAMHAIDDQGTHIQVESGMRTVAQQFMLYAWARNGDCKIPIAAKPGGSLHETGQALDVSGSDSAKNVLRDHGFADNVKGDAPHFSLSAATDLTGVGVQAFQRLWNRNHPDDTIDEDGQYGTQTEQRIALAPALGFTKGAGSVATPTPEDPTPTPEDPTPEDPTPTPEDPQATPDMAQPPPDFAEALPEGNEPSPVDMAKPKQNVPAVTAPQQPGCSAAPGTTSSAHLALLMPVLVLLLLRRRRHD